MATLQKRKSRGYTYGSIIESRRVNGKPRPVILKYLGTFPYLQYVMAYFEQCLNKLTLASKVNGEEKALLDSSGFF